MLARRIASLATPAARATAASHGNQLWAPLAASAAGRRSVSGVAGASGAAGGGLVGVDAAALFSAAAARTHLMSFLQQPLAETGEGQGTLAIAPPLPAGLVGLGAGVEALLVPGAGGAAEEVEAMNRNARRPKKANHGKRPNSHVGRRKRRIK